MVEAIHLKLTGQAQENKFQGDYEIKKMRKEASFNSQKCWIALASGLEALPMLAASQMFEAVFGP